MYSNNTNMDELIKFLINHDEKGTSPEFSQVINFIDKLSPEEVIDSINISIKVRDDLKKTSLGRALI